MYMYKSRKKSGFIVIIPSNRLLKLKVWLD